MSHRWCEFFYPRVDSTMDRARELAPQVPAQTAAFAVRTGHQFHGRGRRGNRWYQEPGSALLMTLAIRRGGRWDPQDPLPSTMALRTAAAVYTALQGHPVSHPLRIKWPNDILLGGHKLCGILLEATPGWFFAGIGLNLRVPTSVPCTVDDLAPTGLYGVLPPDCARLWYHRVSRELGCHLSGDRWRKTVQAALAWREAQVEVRTADSVLLGTISGIDPQGGLLLKDPQTGVLLPPVFSGTVRLNGASSSAAT